MSLVRLLLQGAAGLRSGPVIAVASEREETVGQGGTCCFTYAATISFSSAILDLIF